MPTSWSVTEFWFDERAATGAVRFFERILRHTKGEWGGRPFTLEPWQRERVIRPLFGWKRPDGTRQVSEAVPGGSSKERENRR